MKGRNGNEVYIPDLNPDLIQPFTVEHVANLFYPGIELVNPQLDKMRPDGKHYFFRATLKPIYDRL